jgi:hypothetical protein
MFCSLGSTTTSKIAAVLPKKAKHTTTVAKDASAMNSNSMFFSLGSMPTIFFVYGLPKEQNPQVFSLLLAFLG